MKDEERDNIALPTKAVNLAGMISYQEGSVVSRTLIDKAVGTVTLFAFDEGQGLSEHTVPYDAMVVAVEGEVEITIAGGAYAVTAGEMLIMPPTSRTPCGR